MKKLTFTIALLFAFAVGFGQSKPLEKDSLNQNSPLLSISDVNEFIGLMAKKFTVEQLQQFQELAKFLDERTKQRVAEYYQKPKKN
jgi:hypothetical protein